MPAFCNILFKRYYYVKYMYWQFHNDQHGIWCDLSFTPGLCEELVSDLMLSGRL